MGRRRRYCAALRVLEPLIRPSDTFSHWRRAEVWGFPETEISKPTEKSNNPQTQPHSLLLCVFLKTLRGEGARRADEGFYTCQLVTLFPCSCVSFGNARGEVLERSGGDGGSGKYECYQ